jgi:hypothetical protein
MLKELQSILEKIPQLFATVWGWVLMILSSLWAVAENHAAILLTLLFVIVLDLAWGIAASVKRGEYVTSEAMRCTAKKIIIYMSMILPVMFIEHSIDNDWYLGTRIVVALAAACELWSVSANILAVKPDMPFLRIFRLQLKGEIEKRTGVNTDEILKENNGKGE